MTVHTPEVVAAIQEAFDTAVAHYRNGQFEAAEELYRAILELDSQHPNTNYNLGLLLAQLTRIPEALPFLNAALMAAPQEGKFWVSYLEALATVGEYATARQTLTLGRQHGLHPSDALIALIESGPAPAPLVVETAATHQKVPEAVRTQIQQALQRKDYQSLEKLGEATVAAWPDAMSGWQALSLARFHTGRAEEALEPTQKLVELFPENAQTHANLGLMLMASRRLPEAEACLLQAIALDPKVADSHTNLGTVRRDQNRNDEAEICYRRAIVLDPKHAVAHSNLGTVLNERGDFRGAEASLRTALELDPDNPSALGTLATALVKLGLLEEAETILYRAIELKPDHLLAYDLLLFTLNYTHTDKAREARELAVRYGEQLTQKTVRRYREWNCSPSPQRLKIGVVSGDLRHHPIGYFIEALLRNVDPARIDVTAYSSMPLRKHDDLTKYLRPLFSAWHDIHLLSPEQAAAQIHADGIHVLLDLAGHTGNNRLSVFAMKPAPVQASWLGYFATTGVAEMDGFIGDPWLCPPEEEGDFTETIWRLPKTWLCFTPPRPDVAVAELPALKNGHVTFGCFNNLNKMNDAVVALWAKVLQRVPASKLLLKAPQFDDAEAHELTQQRFAAHAISADRLILEGPDTRENYLAAYGKVDLCLDPFPYPGGTTSVESLWMGVPVLTLRGNRFLSHLGESIAHNASLSDWIAADTNDYINKATTFATDLSALAALRAGMRERMLASPLLDAKGFAHGFENLLWDMWNKKDLPRAAPAPKQALHKKPPPAEVEQLKQLFHKQRFTELEKKGARLTQRYPHAVAGWKALSLAQQSLGKLDEAVTTTQKLLELLPDEAVTHARLGAIFADLNRLQEAETALLHALKFDPKFADAHVNLGVVRRRQKRLSDATACFRQAIEINPAHAIAHYNLGGALLAKRDYRAAEQSFRAVLALESNDIRAQIGLVGALSNLGLLQEAEAVARRLIELQPDDPTAYSMLLFILNYGHNADTAFELAQRYGAMLSHSIKQRYTSWGCAPTPTRLKVGLVSGDLNNHPVGYFLEGVLRALDPGQVELTLYSNNAERQDDTSKRLQACCAAWKDIDLLDDDAAAALIHDDGIHVLIDLTGHTGNNRLPVFARKPAPVQASWLGYFATTGVAEIDFFIGDPNVCPPGEESQFTERVVRLPETYLCFTPPSEDIPINALPALTNGYITYGCFNNASKLDDAVIALWSEILKQAPSSRLLLKAKQFDDEAIRTDMHARFAARGITEKQLTLEGRTPRKDYLASYNRIDIVLDPFPYPGGTTSVEALWMGIPVLTLKGDRFLSHAGENIMRNLGLPEWIAADQNEYLNKAIAFATDTNALSALRARLRNQALASPMFDAPRFARFFEKTLWDMWHTVQGTATAATFPTASDLNPQEPDMHSPPQMATDETAAPLQPNRFVWQQYLDVESADLVTGYHDGGRPSLAAMYTNQPSLILDIGCAAGGNAMLIKERFPGSQAWGIETNRAAAKVAQTKLDRVLVGMFEDFDLEQEGMAKGTLDAVLLADVLEHMYNPWKVMTTLRPYMSPTGQLVLSIPNVRNMILVDQLSKGNWTYEGAGLLDITHIRFFTYQECLKFCKETGYRVLQATSALDKRLKSIWESNMAVNGPANITLDRLVLKDVTRAELLEMCSLQFYFLLEKAPD